MKTYYIVKYDNGQGVYLGTDGYSAYRYQATRFNSVGAAAAAYAARDAGLRKADRNVEIIRVEETPGETKATRRVLGELEAPQRGEVVKFALQGGTDSPSFVGKTGWVDWVKDISKAPLFSTEHGAWRHRLDGARSALGDESGVRYAFDDTHRIARIAVSTTTSAPVVKETVVA